MIPRLAPLLLFAIALPALAQEAAPDATVLERVRARVEAERRQQHIPGLSVAVVVDDQLVWSEGFGFADLESGARATGSTVYRIGSVSKPIVATALMQLVERGRVDLDAELQTYVPEFPRKRWPITVRHLLTHTSGIRHYRGREFLSAERFEDLVAPTRVFRDDPLLFQPGTRERYSTYAFNLVANVVANVSGLPIETYMRRHVYGPAWMNDTGLEDPRRLQPGRARWYERDAAGNWRNAPYVDLSNKYAGGGITSTVEDLARFHIAYQRGRLLRPETIERMYTNQRLADGTVQGFGLSWVVKRVRWPDGRRVLRVGHSGGSVGANTLFQRYPELGFAVAVVANHSAKLGRIVQAVTRAFATHRQLRLY